MKAALRIAGYYALLSGLYIVFSDWAVDRLSFRNPDVALGWQNLKGIAFVLASAAIIFGLTYHYVRRRNLAETAREEARRSFEHLFRRNPLPVFVYDVQSLEFLAANEAAEEEYGYTEEEFRRLRLPAIHREEDVEKLAAHVSLVRGHAYAGHWRHRRKDESLAEMEIVSHDMTFAGRAARLAVATNISIRKITEKALADAFVARLDAEEAKTRFLGAISHEMRTPLNAIMGFLELLPRETNEALRAEYTAIAQKSAESLLQLIERLIEAAALPGTAAVAQDTRQVELAPFLQRVVESYRQQAARKNITLEIQRSPSLPPTVALDPGKVEAILEILIGNAVKFSHGGTIRLSVEPREDGGLEFAVADDGIGIPPEEQDRVFDSFFQVDQGQTRKYGGLGMGLFVARQLCELIGARLEVSSTGTRGSTFAVILRRPDVEPTDDAKGADGPAV